MILPEKDELDLALKKYKLDDLLFLIAKTSQEMYHQGEFMKEISWHHKTLIFTQKQAMPIWGLAELSYRAIKNSNDYKSLTPDMQSIYGLNNLLAKVTDMESSQKPKDKNIDRLKGMFMMFTGISQTQFWWQELIHRKVMFYNFLRYYLLLNEMPNYFTEFVHPNKDLLTITGFGIQDFSTLLCAGYALLFANSPEIDPKKIEKEVTEKNPIITPENLSKCLNFFIGDYAYYRAKSHTNNPLFFKPIIRTQTNRLIISNAFIWVRKFYEGIYWIIRDKYARINSRDFTAAFGYYYEKYIEKLLEYYLKKEMFRKISEEGKADWLIYSDKYLLIVEQKSSLMSISLKKEYLSEEELDKYLEIFLKAYNQLENTCNMVKEKHRTIIKFILHFEKLYFQEAFLKKELAGMCKVNNLKGYYLIDTEEFEQLIQTLSEDMESFNKIVETKINCEDNPPSPLEGTDFRDVINKVQKWKKVRFLDNYSHIFDNLVVVEEKTK